MAYLITAVLGYLLGSSSMAYYLSKLKKVDLRSGGSGNLGASNTTVLLGWGAGVLVALHDIAKSALAVYLAQLIFPDAPCVGAVAGVSSVLGHIFPFYLNYQGGKGFASFFGMTLALNWKLALIVAVLAVVITVVTDYISLATTATVIVVPVYMGFATGSVVMPLILLIATAVMIYKHRMNYVRIIKGEEIGLRSTAKGEHRVK